MPFVESEVSATSKPMRNWGDLNIALNSLVREGRIGGFKTNREEKDARPRILVTVASDADADEAVRSVRSLLSGIFCNAEVTAVAGT